MAHQTSHTSRYVAQSAGQPVSHNAARVGAIRVPVLWAHDLAALSQHRGSYVEVIGKAVDIARRRTKDGKPYVFINFGDWKKGCFRVVLWSEALDSFAQGGLDPQSLMGVWLSARGILEIYQGSQGANPPQIAPDRPERITLFHSEAEAEQWWRSAIAAAQPSPATLAPPPDIAVSPPVPAHPSVSTQQVPATSAPPPVTAVVSPPIPAHPVTTDTTTILSSAVTSPAAPPICSYCAQPVRAEAKICSQCGSPRYPLTRLRPGELLNRRYTVKRAISRGGMGEIYLAVDGNVFGRHVVIKVMLDYFDAGDVVEAQAAQQMFEREAQTLAALSHPAIPKIHDFFQIKADAFIVMEHIAGDNLEAHLTHADMAQRRVPGHPYPTEVGIRYGLEIARVLQYLAAIESGPVVHQDIKPANLLLDPTGIIRLVDFGTARPQTAVKGNARGAGQTTAYGTPGYAPREQYQGQTEPRSDIYALAATIYHLVTDDDPRAHPFSFPHLSQLGLLGHVLTKALSERVDQRPDAQAFAGELQQLPTRVTAEAQQEQDRIEAARRKAEEATQRQAQIDADRRRDKEAAQRQAQIDADRRKADAEARQRQAQIEAARRKAETEAQQQQALIENERRKADAEAAQRQAQIDADRRELEVQKERDWLYSARVESGHRTAFHVYSPWWDREARKDDCHDPDQLYRRRDCRVGV